MASDDRAGEFGKGREGVEQLDDAAAKNAMSKNVIVSLASRAFYLATRLFLPPLILLHVSLEEYGIWACCFVLISYLGMTAFGVSNVYIRYVAEYHSKGKLERIGDLVSTGVTTMVALCALVLPLIWVSLPKVIAAFKISEELERTAFVLFFGTAAIFTLDMTLGAFSDVLTGLQRIATVNKIWVVTSTGEALLSVVLLFSGFGIYSLLIAYIARTLVHHASCIVSFRRALPGVSVGIGRFQRSYLSLFYRYGSVVQITGLLSMGLRSIEKVLAGLTLGVSATGLFEVGEKFPMMATSISSSMNGVLFPMATYLHGQAKKDQLAKLYLKGSRYLSIVTGLMTGFMPGFAAVLITAWMGSDPQYADAALIMVFFALPWHINILTGPGSAFFRGIEKPKYELSYPISQLALVTLFVGIAFLTVGPSILSISAAVSSAMVLSAIGYVVFVNRYFGFSQGAWFARVLLPGLVPYAVSAALGYALRDLAPWAAEGRWNALQLVLGAGIAYTALSALVILFGLTDWGEREYLRLQVQHTLGGLFRVRHKEG